MGSSEQQLLEGYRTRLEMWGWRWRLPEAQGMPVLLTHFGSVLDATLSTVDLQVKHAHVQTSLVST